MSLAEEADARKARLLALRRRKEGQGHDQEHECEFVVNLLTGCTTNL